jgi:hypothetical protein
MLTGETVPNKEIKIPIMHIILANHKNGYTNIICQLANQSVNLKKLKIAKKIRKRSEELKIYIQSSN